jgi:hypothetical protein
MLQCSRRPLALLCLLASLSLALLAAGCGSEGSAGGGDGDARALLKRALAKQVDSGDLKLELDAELEGSERFDGPFSASLSGPFASAAGDELPQLDWDIAYEGQGQSGSGGLVVTEDNAFVEFGGQNYEVGAELYGRFERAYEEQQSEGPQSLEALGIEAEQWLEDPTVEDGEAIGGDPTQLVTGTVDIGRVVEDIGDLTRSPAFRQQLESQGQSPPEEPSEEELDELERGLEEAVEDISFEASIDEQDILRRLALEVVFTVPEDADADGIEGGTIAFDYTLESVGGSPEIEAPSDAAPISQLLRRLGLGGLGNGGSLGSPGPQ